ncbi:MAG: adenylate/guanylate cyclase domain-containing protein [Magnetococcales bacterium]|nr:adenylate/guanylate cyclase domain-containing protein [Magnetococcales bacterium]
MLLHKFISRRVGVEIAVFFLLTILLVTGRLEGLFETVELSAYDWTVRLQLENPQEDKIVQILASEEDLNQFGWPLSDQVVSKILQRVIVGSPRVVGLDLYREQPRPPGHEQLLSVLQANKEIIAVYKFGDSKQKMVPMPPTLKGLGRAGFADWVIDGDGAVRQGLLFLNRDGQSKASFALHLGLKYLALEGITPQPGSKNPQHLLLGKTTLPPLAPEAGGYSGNNPGGYRFLLTFNGGENPFPTYSFLDLIEDRIPPEKIKDSIVIIGTGADSVKDQFFTPYNRGRNTDNPYMFGPTLHAHSVNQLLHMAINGDANIITLEEVWEYIWLACWVLFGMILGRTPFNVISFTLRIGLGGLGPLFIQLGLMQKLIWLPSATATCGFFLAAVLATALASKEERKQRQLLKSLFDKSVSPAVAKEILSNLNQVVGEGKIRTQKLHATVLFTDLANFTTVAEKMAPEVLMEWLNDYMNVMAGKVMDHGGVVDKFIGDAIMALFGVPVAREIEGDIDQDVINAVSCALSMGQALENELIPEWKKRNLPEVSMRVGIHSGSLVAGGLGHHERMDYTVIGDTVNVAARLESLKPSEEFSIIPSNCRILVSEAACDRLGGKFKTHPVGEIILKGKSIKIGVHQILGYNS